MSKTNRTLSDPDTFRKNIVEKLKTFLTIANSIVTYDKKKTFSGLAQILKKGDCSNVEINGKTGFKSSGK